MGADASNVNIYGPQTHVYVLEAGEVVDLQLINWFVLRLPAHLRVPDPFYAGTPTHTPSICTATSTRWSEPLSTSPRTTRSSTLLTLREPRTPCAGTPSLSPLVEPSTFVSSLTTLEPGSVRPSLAAFAVSHLADPSLLSQSIATSNGFVAAHSFPLLASVNSHSCSISKPVSPWSSSRLPLSPKSACPFLKR